MNKDHHNIFVLDWDDTLFPTAVINNARVNFNDYNMIIEWKSRLMPLDLVVSSFIRLLKKNGKVVIITNATRVWITISSVLLPQVSQLIKSDVDIISARDEYGQTYNDIFEWKKNAFLKKFDQEFHSQKQIHFYSIGDAYYEKFALIHINTVYDRHQNITFKNIKLMDKPSIEQLIDQYTVLNDSISSILPYKYHLDLNFYHLNNI
jgi:hypothetical protein